MEYYDGILFLTTNRCEDLDQTFISRIHIALRYPLLDLAGTRMVWKNNIAWVTTRPDLVVDEQDLLQYAEELYSRQQKRDGAAWNGREIRNAFQSAVALAQFRLGAGSEARLNRDHFESVCESHNGFDKVMRDVNLNTDADAAIAQDTNNSARKRQKIGDAVDPSVTEQVSRRSSMLSHKTASDSDDPTQVPNASAQSLIPKSEPFDWLGEKNGF